MAGSYSLGTMYKHHEKVENTAVAFTFKLQEHLEAPVLSDNVIHYSTKHERKHCQPPKQIVVNHKQQYLKIHLLSLSLLTCGACCI